MSKINLCLFVGVFMWGFVSCSKKCPDGKVCAELDTCCLTKHGYGCCPYPRAVCCPDMAHCCPSGFTCNTATQMCEKKKQPWMNIPMVKKDAAEQPSTPLLSASLSLELANNHISEQQKTSIVPCDSYYHCPDRYTCCHHPKGGWFCCPYYPGRCCLDGYHCCPYGYDCDHTYTQCVRDGLRYPFPGKQPLSSIPATFSLPIEDQKSEQEKPMTRLTESSGNAHEAGVIRCDAESYCSPGFSCCKGDQGQWNCCPFRVGMCCADGHHCCEYGYTCESSSLSCKKKVVLLRQTEDMAM